MNLNARPLIIGHRGAAGLVPENTLPSFARAIELGVDAVELDVHVCAGRLCVIHDPDLDRTTSGTGPISARSLEELRALDAGNGERVPFLEEVFDLVPARVAINVELKGPATAAPLANFIANSPSRQVLVSSFDHRELAAFQTLAPEIEVAPLFGRWRGDPIQIGRQFASRFINLSRKIVTPQRCQLLQDAGFEILVYTVNELVEATQLFELGVKGVFTDYPDRLRPAFPAD